MSNSSQGKVLELLSKKKKFKFPLHLCKSKEASPNEDGGVLLNSPGEEALEVNISYFPVLTHGSTASRQD